MEQLQKVKKRFKYRPKHVRLRLILHRFDLKGPFASKTEAMLCFVDILTQVERTAFHLNRRFHFECKRLTRKERKRMRAYKRPPKSYDVPNVFFDTYEKHCLLVSADGALAIYKRDDAFFYGIVGQYEEAEPLFSKPSSNGTDVFGRPQGKTIFK